MAESEDWDPGDYSVESQLLDVQFQYWLPRLASYSIVILLSSIVETQLFALARRVGKRAGSAFDPNDLKGSILDRTAVYLKKVSGSELGKNSRWQKLRDLQDLRDTIVHRAGKPGNDGKRLQQMRELYPGISTDENPYTIEHDAELGITVHSCRYFAGEVEEFFKGVFKDAGLPVKAAPWPNIQTGFSQSK